MFCPQCGHRQVSQEIRFCSRCGFSLGLVADLVDQSGTQLRREKREVTGIGMMIATVIMLVNFIIVYGVVTLPHLANPVFFWIWIFFVVSAFTCGGVGLANLIRGGFFKRLKEREARLHLLKSGREQGALPEEAKTVGLDAATTPHLPGTASVTETTTRELKTAPRANQQDLP